MILSTCYLLQRYLLCIAGFSLRFVDFGTNDQKKTLLIGLGGLSYDREMFEHFDRSDERRV